MKIRIVSALELPINFKEGKVKFKESSIRTVIIQIHGGGFISSTSKSHQSYIRRWANMIPDSVIISMDYRLSPEWSYPAPLDDIWQGYYWILSECKKQLGINPVNVIVVGDSAGGNFAMGLVLRCIHTGIRIPDGLLLAYPGNFYC